MKSLNSLGICSSKRPGASQSSQMEEVHMARAGRFALHRDSSEGTELQAKLFLQTSHLVLLLQCKDLFCNSSCPTPEETPFPVDAPEGLPFLLANSGSEWSDDQIDGLFGVTRLAMVQKVT